MVARASPSSRLALAFIAAAAPLSLAVSGCSCAGVTSAIDVTSDMDAAVEFGHDAAHSLDARTIDPTDGSPHIADTGITSIDASSDALAGFDCASCAAAGPCETLRCTRFCEYARLDDGQPCGEGMICLAGACVARGCGDGWRELGPTPAPESCDDGNDIPTDTCRNCQPAIYPLLSRPEGEDRTSGSSAIAIDGRGHALALVSSLGEGGGSELLAFEFDARGAPIERAPLALGGAPITDRAVVSGRPSGGWAVAVPGESLSVWLIDESGGVSGPHDVSEAAGGAHTEPTIASGPEGDLLVAWTDLTLPTNPHAVLRWPDPDAVPTGEVEAFGSGSTVSPAVGQNAEGIFIVVWTELPSGMPARLVGRRRSRDVWIDDSPFAVSEVRATSVVLAEATEGWWAAWVDRALDPDGDIYVRAIGAEGPPLEDVSAIRVTGLDGASRTEAAPSIAAYGESWIAAWEVRFPPGIEIASGTPLDPASETLIAEISNHAERGPALATVPRGTWFLWTDDGSDFGEPTARSSVLTYLLPLPRAAHEL